MESDRAAALPGQPDLSPPIDGAESAPGRGIGSGRVGALGTILLTIYFVLLTALILYGLIQLWPSPTPAGGLAPSTGPVNFLVWTIQISDEVRLFLIVALTGALGALVHALRSVSWYVGNRSLVRSWLTTYVLLPFVGTTLALIFYLVIRGGFFSPQSTFQQTSPFGFAAMAGLVGMFSPHAVLKLQQVAETLLTKPGPGADAIPQAAVPLPANVTGSSPALSPDTKPQATGNNPDGEQTRLDVAHTGPH